MTFFAEERAVSPVLGGILMFGLAMSLLILTQVSVVPAANQQVEFEHNLGVQEDFERFQGSAARVAASGASETVEMDLGVRYPNRFFLVNPSPASGSLTTESTSVTLANVNATNPETAEYFASQQPTPYTLEYDTNRLVYEPNYRQYGNAPRTVYEHGTVFNRYDGDVTLAKSTVPLVRGNEITLVLVDGDVSSQSVDSTALGLQAASAPAQRISVTDNGAPITITLETFLPASDWQDFAAAESAVTIQSYTDSGDSATPNEVVLALDDGNQYTLRVAKLTIGENTPTTDRAYVTSVGSYAASTPVNTGITYTVELRDAQNNAFTDGELTGVINGTATFSNSAKTQNVSVDEDGRATFVVTGDPNKNETVFVDIGRDSDNDGVLSDEQSHMTVRYTVEFVTTDVTINQADVGNAINPGWDSGNLVFELSSTDNNNVTMVFNNTGKEATITDVRLNYYFAAKSTAKDYPQVVDFKTGGTTLDTLVIGGRWAGLDESDAVIVPAAKLQEFSVVLYKDTLKTTKYTPSPSADDFFMLSLEFSDGSTKVYIIPVSK